MKRKTREVAKPTNEGAGVPPAPAEIVARRKACKLSQTEAGVLVYSALRTWQQWEAGDREMHPGLWELFLIKSGQLNT